MLVLAMSAGILAATLYGFAIAVVMILIQSKYVFANRTFDLGFTTLMKISQIAVMITVTYYVYQLLTAWLM